MTTTLKNHPFDVEAFFDYSVVLTFAVEKEQLASFLPDCLTLDTFNDKWAFMAVALVKTKGLRPKGFPTIFGSDFFLIGYRIFVRYTNNYGKRLRGLYIIKSETDKKKMEILGNIFTHYKYTTTDINEISENDSIKFFSKKSNFSFKIDLSSENYLLPNNSPFKDLKEARKFSGPLPFTFSYDSKKKEILIIEGIREHWLPKPVEVLEYHFNFLDEIKLKQPILANAFIINQIPYWWKKGKKEKVL